MGGLIILILMAIGIFIIVRILHKSDKNYNSYSETKEESKVKSSTMNNILDVREEVDESDETYEYGVVGESHYDIGSIVNNTDVHGFEIDCMCSKENNNPYDKNAIIVSAIRSLEDGKLKGDVVGYLNRENAQDFRKKIKGDAVITRGYITGHEGLYGVTLEFPFALDD